jgi:hypothetical protein
MVHLNKYDLPREGLSVMAVNRTLRKSAERQQVRVTP